MAGYGTDTALLCRVRTRLCALPIAHVIEVMRPLPVAPTPKAPHFVRGLSIIRGAPVPVLDLARLFDVEGADPMRLVTIRANDRCVALAVDTVVGIRSIPANLPQPLPPLLRDAADEVVSAIATLDAELFLVLESARIVPDSVWKALEPEVVAS